MAHTKPTRRGAVVVAAADGGAAAADAAAPAPLSISAASTRVVMRTLPTCKLAVSYYPTFAYNAGDGGGEGRVRDLGGGRLQLTFDPAGALMRGSGTTGARGGAGLNSVGVRAMPSG